MYIETERLVIRDLEPKDKYALFRIIYQPGMLRYMPDWAEHNAVPEDFDGWIAWHQSQKDSTDVFTAKRYAVVRKGEDELIGSVGMGLNDDINQVELAYFMDENCAGHGYAAEAAAALAKWCFAVSSLPYLVLTIDEANAPSRRTAEKAGFVLKEIRESIGEKFPNMVSQRYCYYRLDR